MERTRRLVLAAAAAGGSILLMTSGAFAAGTDHSCARAGHDQPATTSSGQGCDVPGRSCDPSKTDHDNGVGNNCDPGYGRGNQAKFPDDESSSSCRTSGAGSKPAPAAGRPVTETPAPPACSTVVTHEDNESATGSVHESSTAEAHDSGTRTETGDCVSGVETGGTAPAGLQKVTLREESKTMTVTLVVTSATGETETIALTFKRGESAPVTATVNGVPMSESNLAALLGGELTVTPVSGGFTVTLPGGMVLSLSGTTVTTSGGATVAPGASTQVGGVEVANTTPTATGRPAGAAGAATLPTGSVLGMSSVAGMAANAAAGVGVAVSAAQGMPLASTGLPIGAGLVGLLLLGTGFAARRRR